MPQQVRGRKTTIVPYSINNKESKDLSRGMVYRELYLNLSGAITALAGANVYADILPGDEWACVKRLEIVANGTDVLRSLSGNALRWLNLFQFGAFPQVSPLLGAGGANPAFDSTIVLPFWMPNSVHPIDTALDSRELSALTIEITWGSFVDILAAASAWTTEPTLDVYSLESFNVKGPFNQSRIFPIEETITASNTQHKVRLPVNNMYRGLLINTTDAGVDDGDIINNIKIISGSTVFRDYSEEVLDALKFRAGLDRGFSGTAYDDYAIGDGNSIDGWYWLDFVTDGYLTEAIDTLGFSEFEIELDLTVGAGTTKITVMPVQIVPIRGQIKGG